MGTSSSLTSLSSSTLSALAYSASQSALATETSQSASESQVSAVASDTLSAMASSMVSAMASTVASGQSALAGSLVEQLSLTQTVAKAESEKTEEAAEVLSVVDTAILIEQTFKDFIIEKLAKELDKTGQIKTNFSLILEKGPSEKTVQDLETVLGVATKLMPNEHMAVFNKLVEPAKASVKELLAPMFQNAELFKLCKPDLNDEQRAEMMGRFNYAVDLSTKVAFIECLYGLVSSLGALSPSAPDYFKHLVSLDTTCQARQQQAAENSGSKEEKSEKDEKKV